MSKPIMACGCAANSKLVTKDGEVDACVVHGTSEVAAQQPQLQSRKARCCGPGTIVDSRPDLPFFEFRGEGSFDATERCKCGYMQGAHDITPKPPHLHNRCCDNFTPRGPAEFDLYYCGHGGWD